LFAGNHEQFRRTGDRQIIRWAGCSRAAGVAGWLNKRKTKKKKKKKKGRTRRTGLQIIPGY